jgi:hypothetical protein
VWPRGAVVRESVSTRSIEVAAGLVTIAAVIGLSWRPTVTGGSPASATTLFAAGGVGGLLGVTTSLNGVPPALLLVRERASPTSMVVDLGAYFVVGNTLTILVLVSRGAAGFGAAWPLVAVWLPVGLLGQALGVFPGRSAAREPLPLDRAGRHARKRAGIGVPGPLKGRCAAGPPGLDCSNMWNREMRMGNGDSNAD